MNLFELAKIQLAREGVLNKFSQQKEDNLMLDRAITIRHYFDMQERNKKVRKNQLKNIKNNLLRQKK
jgi:hypothetical protein